MRAIDFSKLNTPGVFNMLVNHLNYSLADVVEYDELTDAEQKIISKELWDKVIINV